MKSSAIFFISFIFKESASADEGPSDSINSLNWRGNRRVSYLMATSSSTATPMAHKLSDTTVDADDEDSDALNVSNLRIPREFVC